MWIQYDLLYPHVCKLSREREIRKLNATYMTIILKALIFWGYTRNIKKSFKPHLSLALPLFVLRACGVRKRESPVCVWRCALWPSTGRVSSASLPNPTHVWPERTADGTFSLSYSASVQNKQRESEGELRRRRVTVIMRTQGRI